MGDYELAIINACQEVFPDASYSGCFFHLCQSIYRKVQKEGLQTAYGDENNSEVRIYTRMIMAMAFVPVYDVIRVFRLLLLEIPDDLVPVATYFDQTYVRGIPVRGRRRHVPPRYALNIWNQYDAAINNKHKTNNLSEGWHNRFHLLMGKNHPDLYSLLIQFQKEQGATELTIAELNLGKSVKAGPKKKWYDHQQRVRNVVMDYENFKNESNEMDYLKNLAYNINI